jgi:hypothetical protein
MGACTRHNNGSKKIQLCVEYLGEMVLGIVLHDDQHRPGGTIDATVSSTRITEVKWYVHSIKPRQSEDDGNLVDGMRQKDKNNLLWAHEPLEV